MKNTVEQELTENIYDVLRGEDDNSYFQEALKAIRYWKLTRATDQISLDANTITIGSEKKELFKITVERINSWRK